MHSLSTTTLMVTLMVQGCHLSFVTDVLWLKTCVSS